MQASVAYRGCLCPGEARRDLVGWAPRGALPGLPQGWWQAWRGAPSTGLQSAPRSRAPPRIQLRQRLNVHLLPPRPQRRHPPFPASVPGANGERLVRWPGAQKGLVRASPAPPALPRSPNAPFIDRQISRRGPWRFQSRSRAPCWVAGICEHLMAWTPNKPRAALLAASGWNSVGSEPRTETGQLGRPTQVRGLSAAHTPRRTASLGDLRTSETGSWARSWRGARGLPRN